MNSQFRTIILNSMARTLWVEAYMSEVGERAGEANDSTVEIDPKAVEIQRGSMGRDWMDMAPQTPEAAVMLALKLREEVEQHNSTPLEDAFVLALVADLREVAGLRGPRTSVTIEKMGTAEECADALADKFGHYLVMEALGHGVAWEDDHAEMPLEVPDFDNYELRGLVKFE